MIKLAPNLEQNPELSDTFFSKIPVKIMGKRQIPLSPKLPFQKNQTNVKSIERYCFEICRGDRAKLW